MGNYWWIIAILILFWWIRKKRRTAAAVWQIQKRRKQNKEILAMKELAKKFIDKECIISSFDESHQYIGVIKEVTDGAILVEKDGKIQALNLDFVLCIKEYPRKKNGKKKGVVLD